MQPSNAAHKTQVNVRRPSKHQICATGVIHKQAGNILRHLVVADQNKSGGASLKSLTLGPEVIEKRATHALTCQVLRYLPLLRDLVAQVGLLKKHPELNEWHAYVLIYDMLLGQRLRLMGPAEKLVLRYRSSLKALLKERLTTAGVSRAEDLLPRSQPYKEHDRTARVNLLKCEVVEALTSLLEGRPPATVPAPVVDALLPDVLVFPSGTDLHSHPLVASGSLVLQGGSPLPSHVE